MNVFVSVGLLLATIGYADKPDPSTLEAYAKEAAKSGKSAESQVKLALWCEQNGLEAERIKHLATALLTDPNYKLARSLLGLVRQGNLWKDSEKVAAEIKADAKRNAVLAEYNARREKTPETASAQWLLALWCQEKGLEPEAKAHLTNVVRLDPSRKKAWERLGCTLYNGEWLNAEQIARAEAEDLAQHKANVKWMRDLKNWRDQTAAKSKQVRSRAETHLGEVTDPRAARAVWTLFALGGSEDQSRAVNIFSQIESPESSLDLAALAVYSQSPEVRRDAVATLIKRDPRDFVGALIDVIHTPLKYEIRNVGGPGQPGQMFVEGEKFDIKLIYPAPLPPRVLNRVEPVPVPDRPILRVSYQQKQEHKADSHKDTAKPTHPAPAHQEAPAAAQGQNHQGNFGPINPGGAMNVPGQGLPPGFNNNPRMPIGENSAGPRPFTPGTMPGMGMGMGMGDGAVPANQIRVDPFANFPNPLGFMPVPADSFERQRDQRQRRDQNRAVAIAVNWASAWNAAATAEQQLLADRQAVENYNADAQVINDRVLPLLKEATGQNIGSDRQAWSKWWVNERGYAAPESTGPKPVYVQSVPPLYQPNFMRISHSCFAAGTPVRTLDGQRPIESLKVGEQILSQDTLTGSLTFQPISRIFHNKPAATFKVEMGNGESVVSTAIHRFWLTGKGWVMARELKSGDLIRTLGGTATVTKVTPDIVQPVFNLEVAEGQTFFVGGPSVLVHDNSLVRPVPHPFDSPAEVAAAAKERPIVSPGARKRAG